MIKTRKCFLYTLNGTKEAVAGNPFIIRGREVVKISSIDGTISIHVSTALCKSKFDTEEKPTFYTS